MHKSQNFRVPHAPHIHNHSSKGQVHKKMPRKKVKISFFLNHFFSGRHARGHNPHIKDHATKILFHFISSR